MPTGLSQLDALLGGLQPSDLIILAARPSVGKTSMALNIAQHAAVREAKKVAIFSLEMSREQLALRLLSAETGINPRPLQTGFVDETDWTKIATVMNDMATAPMWIDDSPALSVMELRTKARRLEAEQHGLDLIIVDYLQLMQSSTPNKDNNRVQEVSEISRGLKQLARELKVPVLALSQLSRGVEQRGSAEPRLCDLRESGSIEQDADVVIFLYRDGEQNPEPRSSSSRPRSPSTATGRSARSRSSSARRTRASTPSPPARRSPRTDRSPICRSSPRSPEGLKTGCNIRR